MDLEMRKSLNQALAKAIAFQDQGNHAAARNWAARLVTMVEQTFPIGGPDSATTPQG
jgi:hypothetical protein